MENTNKKTGDIGEELAVSYLKRKGWVVLDRNKKIGGGEIDIIGREPSGTLVFVEVKTLKSELPDGLTPEDEVTSAKRIKMERAAQVFANSHKDLVNEKKGWRIDVVAMVLTEPPIIRHYEGV